MGTGRERNGTEKVEVISVDKLKNTITLKREGTSAGFYENDYKQLRIVASGKTVTMSVDPKESHWTGYTTFKNGLVISDELLVSREVTLIGECVKFEATERQFILLNAMPAL